VVRKYLHKHQALAHRRISETRRKNAEIDEERRRKAQEKKSHEEEEFHRRQNELRQQPKIEEIVDDTLEADSNRQQKTEAGVSSSGNVKDSGGDASSKEPETDDDDSPGGSAPPGNGGTTDKYTWTQTLSQVEVLVPVPPGTRAKDCVIEMGAKTLKVKAKGLPTILVGELSQKIKPDDSMWTIVDSNIQFNLEKLDGMRWWSSVIIGDPEIDTKKIVPENSKLSDLDPETRGTVEKMMVDQRQRQLGLPTTDQQKQADLLEKFKKAHPELDFSQTRVNYGGSSNFDLGGN